MDERIITTKIQVYAISELTGIEKKMISVALSATEKAYSPYSGFQVGVAVLLENGEIISGNNQENAAYPSGLCAERVALFYANACYPDKKVIAIAIAAQANGRYSQSPTAPCGACRQVILEAENRFKSPIRILMAGNDTVFAVDSIKELLPLHFGKEHLNEK